MTIDERLSAELRSRAPQVDEQLAWDRIRSAAVRRRQTRSLRLVPASVAAALLLVVGIALWSSLEPGPGPAVAPQSPLLGTWLTSDDDGSTPTMVIQVSDRGFEMLVHDDLASVCSGAPSTMTGTGRLDNTNTMVFSSPTLTCDDGSRPLALSGPSLEEQLRNLTFVLDPQTDTLTDSLGSTWAREGAEDPDPEPAVSILWPQTSLEEVQEAQRLADAGDPDYTWQLESNLESILTGTGQVDPEIFTRFLREQLGWEESLRNPFFGGEHSEGTISDVMYLRCAPGTANPLYPNDPLAGECAPTIDEFRYETVEIDVAQPGRRGVTGIWVVTAWRTIESFQQMTPPSDSEVTALFVPFLQARIDGEGAEAYLDEAIPLLYETSSGARYDGFEFDAVHGPDWPDGGTEFEVRLFAEDGSTVVEQIFRVDRDELGGPLDLEYSLEGSSTIENGQPVAEVPQHRQFMDGEVTFEAGPQWVYSWAGWEFSPTMTTLYLRRENETRLVLLADPLPIETGCLKSPAPPDVAALAQVLRSDPALEVAEPVTATIAGVEAVQIDVLAVTRTNLCEEVGVPEVVAGGTATGLEPGQRMRLFLLDLPEGSSGTVLAIAIVAPESRFEGVMEEAAPILDSLEFHTR
jgi:hypothetical protein